MADWTAKEVDIIVDDYFSMLVDEQRGKPINKTAHWRKLMQQLTGRTKSSIEFKHHNISAVLCKLDKPWIDGYKPRDHYQSLLDSKVAEYLSNHPDILQLFENVATQPVSLPKIDFENFEERRPKKIEGPSRVEDPGIKVRRPVKLDYFEIERANRSLGLTGEELIIKFEKWRLLKAGKESLSRKIEWISRDLGDGLGYDILSRNIDGTDRYIEVKTTKQGKNTPIFFSRNEYEFANEKRARYYLYRVFDFRKEPKMFLANGRFEDFCRVYPIGYTGTF